MEHTEKSHNEESKKKIEKALHEILPIINGFTFYEIQTTLKRVETWACTEPITFTSTS